MECTATWRFVECRLTEVMKMRMTMKTLSHPFFRVFVSAFRSFLLRLDLEEALFPTRAAAKTTDSIFGENAVARDDQRQWICPASLTHRTKSPRAIHGPGEFCVGHGTAPLDEAQTFPDALMKRRCTFERDVKLPQLIEQSSEIVRGEIGRYVPGQIYRTEHLPFEMCGDRQVSGTDFPLAHWLKPRMTTA